MPEPATEPAPQRDQTSSHPPSAIGASDPDRQNSGRRFVPSPAAAGLALIAAAFIVVAVKSPMIPLQGDGYYTYLWSRSLAFDGDFDLRNDYALCGDPWSMGDPVAEGLGPRNQWSPGPSIAWTPMLLLGRLVHPDARSEARTIAAGCHGGLATFGLVGTVLLSLAALLLIYRTARRHTSVGPALVATAGIALASPLTYYGGWLLSYGHAPAAFALALFIERWDATRSGPRARSASRWAEMGALLSLAMLMRPQLAVFVFAPLAEWLGIARGLLRERRALLRHVGHGVLFVLAMLVVFAPQLYAWKITYGTFFALPQGPHYMRWGEPSLDGVLFASTGGLLVWTPLMWVGVVGMLGACFVPRLRALALPLAIAFALTCYINGAVWDYWGSMGFSNRRFTALVGPLGFGIALVSEVVFRQVERWPRRAASVGLGSIVALAAAWNLAAMTGVAFGRIESWRENRSDLIWEQIFHELAGATYRAVGNPLAWPASIPFAIHFDAHPMQYDAMRGMSIYYAEYQDRSPREGEETVRWDGRPLHLLYATDGFAPEVERSGGHAGLPTIAPVARALIPLFLDEARRMRITFRASSDEARPEVSVIWNGRELGTFTAVPTFRSHTMALPPGASRVGVNELELRVSEGGVVVEEIAFFPAEEGSTGEPE